MCKRPISVATLVIVLATPPSALGALVGHWKLDEASGTTVTDSTGAGNDGTVRGGPRRVTGVEGRALLFRGNDSVEIANASRDLKPATVTVAAWVKADPAMNGPGWVAGQGDNYGLAVNRYRDGSVFFYFYDGNTWHGVSSGDVAILDGQWHHVAGVFDDATDRLYVYKDGLKVGVSSAKGPIAYPLGQGFAIGSMQGERRFVGTIDEVRVYNQVLSQSEMDTLASATSVDRPRATAPAEVIRARHPTGVVFRKDTLYRCGDHGDNWCITWAADDSQVTSMCDGDWLGQGHGYHNHLYRILGGPDRFTRQDIPNYPDLSGKEGSWFGYGIVSVDGLLYATASKTPGPAWSGPFRGIKLLKSPDNGRTWYRVNRRGEDRLLTPLDKARNTVNAEEMFFLEEFGLSHQKQAAYPFSYVDFVQCGKDNSAAKDNYLYIYSPEGAHAHKLLLARVLRDKLGVRREWEYFVRHERDKAIWTRDLRQRGYAHVFPEKSRDGNCFGWYSWLPSVVWNEGLGLYIMVNGGTYGGSNMTSADRDYYSAWMHTETGSLGLWWSEKPYGPWSQFYYTDYWTVDDPANRTYQPKLSPKWISGDGKEMVLIWSDAMKNNEGKSHTVNYRWNQMRITVQTE